MTECKVVDKHGQIWTFAEQEGFMTPAVRVKHRYPFNGHLSDHFEFIRNLNIRNDDVYISTYTKSGTHWIWEVVSMVLRRSAEYDKSIKETAMLEFRKPEEMEALPSPRIINSHYPVKFMPHGITDKGCKIIHVRRNIKDAIVSYWHHIKQEDKSGTAKCATPGDTAAFFTGQYGPVCMGYPWPDFIREWNHYSSSHPGQVLQLYFEDMKQDLPREVTKVAKFLGVDLSPSVVQDIADKCTFGKLKQANDEVKVDGKDSTFLYRRGQVGDWKNWFTVAENEDIDRWLHRDFSDGYHNFKYTL